MIRGQKILVTGATGQVAFPIAAFLARENHVWGGARFQEESARERLKDAGIVPAAIDLLSGDFTGLPTDFDYLLHFGFTRGGADDFDRAMRVNGEGTGLILQHCRSAKAALVISSAAIYAPNPDPWHAHKEEGELGRAFAPWSPTSPVTKVAQEAVARFAARAFALPVTIARLNTVYGSAANLPSIHIRQLIAGEEVMLPSDPNNHSPVHVDDMCAQVEALLGAANVPATIVNWAGDEIISAQHWCSEAGRILGVEPRIVVRSAPGVSPSNIADVTRRTAITGPCQVPFADGLARLIDKHFGK